jgi:hypothetical protein
LANDPMLLVSMRPFAIRLHFGTERIFTPTAQVSVEKSIFVASVKRFIPRVWVLKELGIGLAFVKLRPFRKRRQDRFVRRALEATSTQDVV